MKKLIITKNEKQIINKEFYNDEEAYDFAHQVISHPDFAMESKSIIIDDDVKEYNPETNYFLLGAKQVEDVFGIKKVILQ